MPRVTLDGNEAVARVAYALDGVVAIYPITPASPMGELADQWASQGQPNLWGDVPHVIEMQSEGGAAGVLHGALQAGALTTTFTSSQGLLLMVPNLYKIAGELTPAVVHVAARALAAQGLSIFGDHQDVMACRATGCAMLCSGSVQEAQDLAVVAHLATLEGRVPFLHFFDGFRTSHEIGKIELVTREDLRALVDDALVDAHRARALTPERPVIRGTAQNPDVYFQAREAVGPFYEALPRIVQQVMGRLARQTGREYRLVDYVGAPDAERVLVMMGSGAEAAHEAVEALVARGERVGLLKVRLYRPFPAEALVAALPGSVRRVAVLDRTKEPGSLGEPLYLDVVAALAEADWQAASRSAVVGGRYGLASKEFTPAMAKAALDELARDRPKNHFTLGIQDDVSHTSLAWDPAFSTEAAETTRAVFYGLGSDGTVGANKNSIRIIGEQTDLHAQGYFVYDSKKSGSTTISHLRFGPRPIRSTYLIAQAGFVACHQFELLMRLDVLQTAAPGATVLLNSPWDRDTLWDHLPRSVQRQVIERGLRLFAIDAGRLAAELEMGTRINTIMQTCFFALSGVLPRDEAIAAIKGAIEKTYGKRGTAVVDRNRAAVDRTLAALFEVTVPSQVTGRFDRLEPVAAGESAFAREVTAPLIAGQGDRLPVGRLPVDGTWPVGTARLEKRNIAQETPLWDEALCIQCGKCVLVCPHAAIRAKVYGPAALAGAPEGFLSAAARWKGLEDRRYTLQVSTEDCTGCGLCVEACPVTARGGSGKAVNMARRDPARRERERDGWSFFLGLAEPDRTTLNPGQIKDVQLLQPLFEFSGACAGCGETPYLKLITQLFGDRMVVANATGCSSIYGGNLPTTPWSANGEGRGPAWCNSLFEDNAEFGLGIRVGLDAQAHSVRARLETMPGLEPALVAALLQADQSTEAALAAQRARVSDLRARLAGIDTPEARRLADEADALVRRSVWIVGGDGWAYDIGFGGLDHVLASAEDVNLLVLDTEVYSNTGGQMSKATPRGAVAKFAAAGKRGPRKDLAAMAITYGTAYVARIAMGAQDMHTLRVLREAEAFPGPSLIVAYSHCIAHGYDLVHGLAQQKAAVNSGYWPLFRFDPRRAAAGLNPLQLDSKPPSIPLKEYTWNETRFSSLADIDPQAAGALLDQAQREVLERWRWYEHQVALGAAPTPTT